jgi:hypothetical protein
MATVWNLTGSCRIATLPTASRFDNDDPKSEMLTPIAAWRASQVGAMDRKLIVHSDNAKPHVEKKVDGFFANNGMTKVLHPPSWPDLAPCEFFRFGDIKTRLKGRSFDDPDQLFMPIDAVHASIEKVISETGTGGRYVCRLPFLR